MLPAFLAFLQVTTLALPVALGSTVAPEAAPNCPEIAEVQDLGSACRTSDGLLEVFDASGRTLGTTHGPDSIRPEDLVSAQRVSAAGPRCVDPLADPFHVRVIYARAHNDDDRYAQLIPAIRTALGNSLGLLSDAAAATGASGATFDLICDASGEILVEQAVLPTDKSAANFSTITADLKAAGFTDPRAKHWVLYDDTAACTCGGQGHLILDESPWPSNGNNGSSSTVTFAVNYGYTSSARIWLHELAHNLGAVQDSAPNSTKAGHCVDGRDTMCYNDGGPRSSNYSTSSCSTEVFDCGKDDYFNLQPAAGQHLARRWNLGSLWNRYLWVSGIPKVTVIDPAPGSLQANCIASTPGLPEPTGRPEGSAGIVVTDTACIRLEVRGVHASQVQVFNDFDLLGSSSSPASTAGGVQRWQFESAMPSGLGTRYLMIEVTGNNGFVARHPVLVVTV